MDSRPRLPPEILWQILQQLEGPCALGDPSAKRALTVLSLVSKTFRHWALSAMYSVVVAPRHVRDFRKWHSKVNEEIIGYNQALFVALDDVSKLTSTSAGWEADLQRFLQRLGPSLTHLSLWTSETRAVLRDPAQIRGPRFRNRMPIHTMDDQTRAEIAAAKERAKQKMPNWFRLELESRKEEEVRRMYKAQMGPIPREYQHELDVRLPNRDTTSPIHEKDLSICPALPLHEHENALNFARMTIWTRVEELDIFIAVPAEVGRYLELFSSLVASPIIKFRLSSIYASLLITVSPPTTLVASKGMPNIARGLEQVMKSEVLETLLLHEFNNKHLDDIVMLERAVRSVILDAAHCNDAEVNIPFDEKLRSTGGLHASSFSRPIMFEEEEVVKVRILQSFQAHWGKLKDRKQDFLNRSLGLGEDCWDTLMK
ncbi:hypothetical protein CBS101457_004498 [Exobasidium rhododendri]|nr:hypothetical protein CBS101457_004498 [Exobasidium rhododendri]